MVKLNLTGLQTSDSSEIPAWEQIPETTNVVQTTEEAAATEQPNYSFSLSSLIGNTNPTTTQETTNTTDSISTTSDISVWTQEISINQQTEEQPKVESLISIEWISWNTTVNASEEIISINNDWTELSVDEITSEESWVTHEKTVEPEDNREFFKSFDVIREFNEEKWDEIVIWKWETKVETISEENITEGLESVAIMAETNENILEQSKNAAEIAVAQFEEAIIPKMTVVQAAPVNLDTKDDNVTQVTTWESISINDTSTTETNTESVITPTSDIEQAKKDLSATRKPFWIRSFSKKSVITSLWAVFVFWLIAVWLSQMDLLGGKTNIQETVPVIKYVSWTDYTVIANKNKRKNIRKPRELMPNDSLVEVWTWEQINNSWTTIENSGSTTMSWVTSFTGTDVGSGTTNEQLVSPSAAMIPQPGQEPGQGIDQTPRELQWQQWIQGSPNNSNSWIPTLEQTNTPANDMNYIANWAN